MAKLKFQSLKGLQPKWNPVIRAKVLASERVSIPKRVTAKVELWGTLSCSDITSLFQSLKGLQPKWNVVPDWMPVKWAVSIPKRVTAKVEQARQEDKLMVQYGSFQSLKGLQPKWNAAAFTCSNSRFRFNP